MSINQTTKTKIIMLLCMITSTGRFVMDSYLPSMPFMRQDLGVSGSNIELTLTLYLLGFGVSQLIYGPLSDRYGRKPVLMIGFALFLIANTLCALAQSLPILLGARLLAGVGIGASGVLNRAIASDCFSGAEFSKAWSYTITTLVIVLMVAPLIGSGVQTLFDWRANFILTTGYVFVVLMIIVRWLPETNASIAAKTTSPHSLRHIIHNYKTILSTSSFMIGTLCYTLAFAGLIAYFQVSSLLLIETLGLSSLEYGYTSVSIAICYMAGGIIVNRFASTYGTQRLLKIGLILIALSGLWLLSWHQLAKASLISTLLPVFLYVIGARIVIPNAIANSFTGLRHLSGSTSGMIGFIQMLGSAVVSFIITCFNFSSPLLLGVVFTVLGILSLIIFNLPEWRLSLKNCYAESCENFLFKRFMSK